MALSRIASERRAGAAVYSLNAPARGVIRPLPAFGRAARPLPAICLGNVNGQLRALDQRIGRLLSSCFQLATLRSTHRVFFGMSR